MKGGKLMGYNNHHAGMHMIWHRRYAAYDDLAYYDKLAEERRKIEMNKEEKKEKVEMTKQENVVQKPVKQNTKKKQKNKTTQNTMEIPKIAYGTEKIIDIHYFSKMDLVSKNLMIIALKNKIDIGKILYDVENIMKQDERTNGKPAINNSWSWMPMLEKAMIFLSILADKLNCSVQEFFIDNEEVCKKYVYKLLDEIKDWEWDEGFVDAETGNAEICIRYYGDNTFIDLYRPSMDLTISKEYYDEIPNYTLSYGDLSVRALSMYDYLIKGAYLLEEEDGKLKDLVERLIKEHPEWLEE